MTYILLHHQWKAFWRSRSAGRDVAVQIFMGLIILYLLGVAIFIGIFLQSILNEAFPEQDVVTVFCGYILYYFFLDIIFRFMWQDLPTLTVQPYLVQNIERRQLIQFLNLRSLFSFFTLLPLFLFVPFALSVINRQYGSVVSLAFIVTIISLILFNHFLILFIKRKTILSHWWLVGFFVIVLLLIAGDYFQIFSVRNLSASIFKQLLKTPLLCVMAIIIAVVAFYNNSRFLQNNLYLEDLVKSPGHKASAEYHWLKRFGNVGDLIAVDLKLIFRNKRPRSLLLFSCIFLFYGFIFYKPISFENNDFGLLLLGGIFVTGMFMANYGQFFFAWQSRHFDGLMASNVNIKTYLKSKFILLTGFCTAALMLSLFYGFINWKIIPIQIAAYFFNIGIHSVIAAYIGTYNYKGLDLSKGASFNYQGMGATQWLYALIIMLVGFLVYLPFALLISSW
ncbi:MAG: DUF5687 family protein, partial [Bacteroidota bacterium]|nr:DUF5687 family protein [Bacteroidota bacterium]